MKMCKKSRLISRRVLGLSPNGSVFIFLPNTPSIMAVVWRF